MSQNSEKVPSSGLKDQISFTRTLETTTDELTRGTVFAGRYEIIEELGAGGMGRVYRAFDNKIEEEVALKLIRPEIAGEKRTVERFRNEIKTARKITHKNVCRTHDLGEEGKALFITMEYVRGEDLKSLIRRTRALTTGTAVSIARQIAEGLGEAHKLGIIHRDLKPSNVMIDKDGNAKIMDFGIARSLAGAGTTAEGAVIGTPEYMSPEQVEGKPADQRADIYSLGVILFEMVTGRPPFDGETSLAIAHKHKYEPAPDPRALNAQIPPDLDRLILRCLEKAREKRYQTTEELLADLGAVEAALPTTEHAPAGRSATRHTPATPKTITVTFRLQKLLIPISAFIVIMAIGIIVWKALPKKEAGPSLAAKKSVAVLPFVGLSPDKNSELLADGITDALINALSRIRDLRVPGRTSAFSLKGRELDVRDVGQKLNVHTVLEGSVQVMGERIRVAAQLIDVEEGFQIWSDKYDRKMEDVFAIQDDIARMIVDKLKIEILGDKEVPIIKPATGNLEAYKLYLQGRYFWNKRSGEDLQKAVEFFRKAIDIDLKYAPAYAGLADVYLILAGNLFLPPDEAFPLAKENAQKALELDAGLSDAYCTLAVIKRYEWDFMGSERDLKRAIETNPGEANAHNYYALLLSFLGRHEEAIKEIKSGRDLDPLAPRIRANVGFVLYLARKYDEALEELKKALDFDSSHTATYEHLGNVYREIGRYEESIAHFRKAISLEDRPVDWIFLAFTYARAGKIEESRKILKEMEARSEKEYVSPALLAAVHGVLGEYDIAFDLLNKALATRDTRLLHLKSNPEFDPIRSDPRFAVLLKRIGLEK